MTPSKLSGLKPFSSFLLTVALLAFKLPSSGQQGKGASSDDWFIKSAKDRKEQLQQGIKGGEKRDIIPSVPGMPASYAFQPQQWAPAQATAPPQRYTYQPATASPQGHIYPASPQPYYPKV